ncbi:23S rRNA (guanine(745)-N(1))-methyltransferase [Marinobacter salarius]|nr:MULTISPECIES: methyltransferase domain-containing protein [Marinobacter]MCZ4285271.1 methyltransferase domain-containing protein [Marinobacter salarius]OLF82556.1 rRNA (guanine-N1)-methyltransferase [Marinobacter sp. C18]VVT25784.1 23S rRNA (guanine(745)-N(1))-methyltransferase [Marinobacter salarius]VXB52217.1 23S rRNA (guanine(745)-N(1))-methyltransferase [Marinobacter salarius]
MSMDTFSALACPLDGEPLNQSGTCWRCPAGHSFDVARQGYLHLLPVQKKRSLDPGDSKDMVAARRRFLNAGFYQPIAEAVNKAVAPGAADAKPLACLDAGCGEGYYLRQLAAANTERSLALVGVDISKWATLAAAKQDKRPRWLVGSNANLPVLNGSLDCVLCLFGFPVYSEFARVLKPGGILIQADAGPDHLRELREIIYPSLKPEKPPAVDVPEGFLSLGTETIRYSLTLESQEAIADLLAMTPHFYRAPAEGRVRAETLETLAVTVEVTLRRFVRDSAATTTTPR